MPKHAHLADTLPSKDSARRLNLEGPNVVKKERRTEEKWIWWLQWRFFPPAMKCPWRHGNNESNYIPWVTMLIWLTSFATRNGGLWEEYLGPLPRQTPRSGGLSSALPSVCSLVVSTPNTWPASRHVVWGMRVVEWGLAVLVFLIGYPSPNERETNTCGA